MLHSKWGCFSNTYSQDRILSLANLFQYITLNLSMCLVFPPGGISLLKTGVMSLLACHYSPTLNKWMNRSLIDSLKWLFNIYCLSLSFLVQKLFYLGRKCAQINSVLRAYCSLNAHVTQVWPIRCKLNSNKGPGKVLLFWKRLLIPSSFSLFFYCSAAGHEVVIMKAWGNKHKNYNHILRIR